MSVEEGLDQVVGQAGAVGQRPQVGASDLPERRLGKAIAPEDHPSGDGPPVGTEASGQFTDASWRGPLPHGADEDDDGAEVDRSAEESHRGRRQSLAAAVAIAAEAQPEALGLGELEGSAAGLAEIVGGVQTSAAGTTWLAGGLGQILVNGEKEGPEPGGARQIVIHGRVLQSCDKLRSTSLGDRDQVIGFSEGFFLAASAISLRNRGFHVDYLGHAHGGASFGVGASSMAP